MPTRLHARVLGSLYCIGPETEIISVFAEMPITAATGAMTEGLIDQHPDSALRKSPSSDCCQVPKAVLLYAIPHQVSEHITEFPIKHQVPKKHPDPR